jgi:hypothetical protein
MSSRDTLKEQFDAFTEEHDKFVAGNASAGTRARKALAEMGKIAKVIRNEVTAEKNARKEAKG